MLNSILEANIDTSPTFYPSQMDISVPWRQQECSGTQFEVFKCCALVLNWALIEKSSSLNGKWEIALIIYGNPVP